MARDTAQWLLGVEWLGDLGPEDLSALARAAAEKTLARGEALWRVGEQPDALAAVRRGRLDVVRATPRGHRMWLRSFGPTRVVGLSLVAGAPVSADVVAGEPSRVVLLPGGAVRAALAARPAVALAALAHLGELLAQLTDELEELRYLDLDTRVLRALTRRGRDRVEVRLTHEELSEQVGATRENVSRALRRLERRGLLTRRRGRILLHAPARG